jgi:hypothetical protein
VIAPVNTPPARNDTILPQDTIPPSNPMPAPAPEPVIDPAYIIPSIPQYRPAAETPRPAAPAPSVAAQPSQTPQVTAAPPVRAAAPAPAPSVSFSAPVINNLERGMYYIQVGSFSKVEAIEPELSGWELKGLAPALSYFSNFAGPRHAYSHSASSTW